MANSQFIVLNLLKSVHFTLLIERKKFARGLTHILPVATVKFRCQGLSPSATLTDSAPITCLPSLLRAHYLFSTEVSRHRVDSSLIHIILVYLHRVPIVKVVSRPASRKTHQTSAPYQMLLTWEGLFCGVVLEVRTLCLRRVSFLGEGCGGPDGSLTMSGGLLLARDIELFFEMLVFACEFEYFEVFFVVSLVGELKFLSELFVALKKFPDHVNALNQSFWELFVGNNWGSSFSFTMSSLERAGC